MDEKMTYEEALAAVSHFFEKKLRERVEETTSINYDLGLAGIEIHQTLLEWEKYFGISLENMDAERYFWADLKITFFDNVAKLLHSKTRFAFDYQSFGIGCAGWLLV